MKTKKERELIWISCFRNGCKDTQNHLITLAWTAIRGVRTDEIYFFDFNEFLVFYFMRFSILMPDNRPFFTRTTPEPPINGIEFQILESNFVSFFQTNASLLTLFIHIYPFHLVTFRNHIQKFFRERRGENFSLLNTRANNAMALWAKEKKMSNSFPVNKILINH